MANTLGKALTVGLGAYGLFKAIANRYVPGQIRDTRITFDGEDTTDLRVKLIVPPAYLIGKTSGLASKQGIIFPYTPQISFDNVADYTPQNLTHSNYTIYSYKATRVGAIGLQAKFTVQNNSDADYYLTVITLLRALIKMRTGSDPLAGSPPPVCRLKAYGANMLDEVPVVITSFRIDLPTEVDYYTSNQDLGATDENALPRFQASNMIPTVSTIQLSLLPMYSRNEMLQYNVDKWLNDDQSFKGKGYL